MSETEQAPLRITVPITVTTAMYLDAIAQSHPYVTKATLARIALQEGLSAVVNQFPIRTNYQWPTPDGFKPKLRKPSEEWTALKKP